MSPTIPTLHLNGSAASNLREPLIEACGALRKAIATMGDTSPNARDYYPQGEQAYAAARREHEARIGKASELLVEYQLILDGLQDQMDARAAQRRGR